MLWFFNTRTFLCYENNVKMVRYTRILLQDVESQNIVMWDLHVAIGYKQVFNQILSLNEEEIGQVSKQNIKKIYTHLKPIKRIQIMQLQMQKCHLIQHFTEVKCISYSQTALWCLSDTLLECTWRFTTICYGALMQFGW